MDGTYSHLFASFVDLAGLQAKCHREANRKFDRHSTQIKRHNSLAGPANQVNYKIMQPKHSK